MFIGRVGLCSVYWVLILGLCSVCAMCMAVCTLGVDCGSVVCARACVLCVCGVFVLCAACVCSVCVLRVCYARLLCVCAYMHVRVHILCVCIVCVYCACVLCVHETLAPTCCVRMKPPTPTHIGS